MSIVLDGSVGISSIGTLTGVTSISSAAADTPVILQDSSSNSNTCRAWVNFNGTGTVAIRADFNVTSITDNGTGLYTVNITTAMPDANYSCVASCSWQGSTSRNIINVASDNNSSEAPTTTAIKLEVVNYSSGNAFDSDYTMVAIFR